MKRILIVDDQKGIRMLLEEVFKREGFITFLASKGSEALQLIEKEKIDCVLLDMKLSGEDGKEVLKKMKALQPDLPVFVMTAFDDEEMKKETKTFGAVHYFVKPFNIYEVKDAVGKVLLND
ncbi:MAG: response regulator [Lysinibacillus sp.]|nr:response regulator [Lysinibacillus sp.]